MLPSLRCFRGIPCPYFGVGLCDRPHCYFRHAARDALGLEIEVDVQDEREESAIDQSPEEVVGVKTASASRSGSHAGIFEVGDGGKEVGAEMEEVRKSRNQKNSIYFGSSNISPGSSKDGSVNICQAEDTRVEESCKPTKMLATHVNVQPQMCEPLPKSRNGGEKCTIRSISDNTTLISQDHTPLTEGERYVKSSSKKRDGKVEKGEKQCALSLLVPVEKRSEDAHRSGAKLYHSLSARHHQSDTKHAAGASGKHSSFRTKGSDPKQSKSSSNNEKVSNRTPSVSSSQKSKASSSKASGVTSRSKSELTKSSSQEKTKRHKSSKNQVIQSNAERLVECSKEHHTSSTNIPVVEEAETSLGAYSESERWLFEEDDDKVSIDSGAAEEFLLPDDNDCDEDPSELALECLRMFTGYEPKVATSQANSSCVVPPEDGGSMAQPPSPEVVIGKKRVAHAGSRHYLAEATSNRAPVVKQKILTPNEALALRYESLRVEKSNTQANHDRPNESTSLPGLKRRISHVSNVAGLLKQPAIKSPTMTSASSSSSFSFAGISALAQIIGKGEQRVAHKAKLPSASPGLPRPVIMSQPGLARAKIPTVYRQQMLNVLVDAQLEVCDAAKEAYELAIKCETACLAKCSSTAVYKCAVLNTVSGLRKEAKKKQLRFEGKHEPKTEVEKSKAQSHLSVLAGPSGARHSWSIEQKPTAAKLTGNDLYKACCNYILTDEQLKANGYPYFHSSGDKGHVMATKTWRKGPPGKADSNVRNCDRCSKPFTIKPDGFPLLKEICQYHHGRKFKRQVNGMFEARYSCCDSDDPGIGCTVAPTHVSVHPSDEIRGFVSAINKPGDGDSMGTGPWDIVGIDCEMVYTTYGTELARVTFIGSNLEILYDELVKPIHPVLDYNTRFSGITEDMMKSVKISLTDVQAVMLTRFKLNTILVGHSLESDLVALKLAHKCVVDTSVLMPHKMGPPYKRALRNLTSECLGKIIQVGENGHDSAEDARSAMELVFWKIKQDRAQYGWKKRKISLP